MSDTVLPTNQPLSTVTFPAGFSGEGVAAQTATVSAAVSDALEKLQATKHQALYTSLSAEEHQAVLDKMKQVAHQPPGHLPRQEELYLEQQLMDMLGFEVIAELERYRLPHSIGVMTAGKHLRRYPGDQLSAHAQYREAGLAEKRSQWGWFTEMGQLTPAGIQREQFYIGVGADYLPSWHTDNKAAKNWWKYRKMMVINPDQHRAVIGVVAELAPSSWIQHQFIGSPEVMRQGRIWHPNSQGRVLVFFVNDESDSVPLGMIELDQLKQTL